MKRNDRREQVAADAIMRSAIRKTASMLVRYKVASERDSTDAADRLAGSPDAASATTTAMSLAALGSPLE